MKRAEEARSRIFRIEAETILSVAYLRFTIGGGFSQSSIRCQSKPGDIKALYTFPAPFPNSKPIPVKNSAACTPQADGNPQPFARVTPVEISRHACAQDSKISCSNNIEELESCRSIRVQKREGSIQRNEVRKCCELAGEVEGV